MLGGPSILVSECVSMWSGWAVSICECEECVGGFAISIGCVTVHVSACVWAVCIVECVNQVGGLPVLFHVASHSLNNEIGLHCVQANQ